MNGLSTEGDWVLEDRTTSIVTHFDQEKGYGFIRERRMGHEVMVNRRAVKRQIGVTT